MKTKLFFLTALFLITSTIYSQTKATTEKGTKVILFDDGTWEDYEVVNSGDCNDLIKLVETTETKGFMSQKPLILKSKKLGLSLTIVKNVGVVVVSMEISGNKKDICIGPKDTVYIVKSSGEEIELPKSSIQNCNGEYTLFIGKPWKNTDLINRLSNGQIKAIKIKSYEFELKYYHSSLFQKTLNCINEVEIRK